MIPPELGGLTRSRDVRGEVLYGAANTLRQGGERIVLNLSGSAVDTDLKLLASRILLDKIEKPTAPLDEPIAITGSKNLAEKDVLVIWGNFLDKPTEPKAVIIRTLSDTRNCKEMFLVITVSLEKIKPYIDPRDLKT